MKTRILNTTEEDLKIAGKLLNSGKLVAFPTETVYGLGADALNSTACKNVYIAKGRPVDNPMIVHIARMEDLKLLTDDMTEDITKLTNHFWPGPLTIIVNAKDIIPKVTTGGLDTVAIRMPESLVARKIIEYSNCPIAAPSANLSGKPSPTKGSHVIDDLDGKIDAIVVGDDCKVGIESTVIDMTDSVPVVLRPGIITKEEISKVLGKDIPYDKNLYEKPSGDFKPKSPGMKYKHYSPDAKVVIFKGEKEKVEERLIKEKEEAEKNNLKVEIVEFESDTIAARDLFKVLRDCDKRKVDLILISSLEFTGVGFSVMNRMLRSAGYNIIDVE